MTDLLHAALLPANLLPTALLVVVLLYWVTVLAGLLNFDSLDLDVHHPADLHHAHVHATDGLDVSWLNQALTFFNLGRVPLMVLVSFVVLPLWVGSILLTHYLGIRSWLPGLLLVAVLLPLALLAAKFLTLPFVHAFAALEQDRSAGAQPLGKVCTLLLPATEQQLGQASVPVPGGAPLVLNVRATNAAAELRKGDSALVVDYDEQRRCYLIEPYDVH